jgi:hypothetical protein
MGLAVMGADASLLRNDNKCGVDQMTIDLTLTVVQMFDLPSPNS